MTDFTDNPFTDTPPSPIPAVNIIDYDEDRFKDPPLSAKFPKDILDYDEDSFKDLPLSERLRKSILDYDDDSLSLPVGILKKSRIPTLVLPEGMSDPGFHPIDYPPPLPGSPVDLSEEKYVSADKFAKLFKLSISKDKFKEYAEDIINSTDEKSVDTRDIVKICDFMCTLSASSSDEAYNKIFRDIYKSLLEQYPNKMQDINFWKFYMIKDRNCEYLFILLYQKLGLTPNLKFIFNKICLNLYNKISRDHMFKQNIIGIFESYTNDLSIKNITKLLSECKYGIYYINIGDALIKSFFKQIVNCDNETIEKYFTSIFKVYNAENRIIIEILNYVQNNLDIDNNLVKIICRSFDRNTKIPIGTYLKYKNIFDINLNNSQIPIKINLTGDLCKLLVQLNFDSDNVKKLIDNSFYTSCNCENIDNLYTVLDTYNLNNENTKKIIESAKITTFDNKIIIDTIYKYKDNQIIFPILIEILFASFVNRELHEFPNNTYTLTINGTDVKDLLISLHEKIPNFEFYIFSNSMIKTLSNYIIQNYLMNLILIKPLNIILKIFDIMICDLNDNDYLMLYTAISDKNHVNTLYRTADNRYIKSVIVDYIENIFINKHILTNIGVTDLMILICDFL